MRGDELLRAGQYLAILGPVWETATPRERKEIYRLVMEVAYVDVLGKRLVEVVPKRGFAPLFGGVASRRVNEAQILRTGGTVPHEELTLALALLE